MAVNPQELLHETEGGVTINVTLTYPAIVKLLADDEVSVVKLKQQVMDRLAKSYLKPLEHDEQIKQIKRKVEEYKEALNATTREECNKVVGEFKKGDWKSKWKDYVELHSSTKRAIRDHVKEEVDKQVREVTANACKEIVEINYGKIDEYVDRHIGLAVKEEVQRRVRTKLQEFAGG